MNLFCFCLVIQKEKKNFKEGNEWKLTVLVIVYFSLFKSVSLKQAA